MTGYRRIKGSHPYEPSSDLIHSSSQTKHTHKSNQQYQESKTHKSHLEMETGDTHTDKIFGSGAPKLHRNASTSSSSSSLVKRAFSFRRSSSFSERYCKIHDQHVTLSSPLDDDQIQEVDQSFSKEKKSRCKGILKSCKRIFGL